MVTYAARSEWRDRLRLVAGFSFHLVVSLEAIAADTHRHSIAGNPDKGNPPLMVRRRAKLKGLTYGLLPYRDSRAAERSWAAWLLCLDTRFVFLLGHTCQICCAGSQYSSPQRGTTTAKEEKER